MIAQFADSVTALETIFASASSPLVAVVVTGIGRNFCSGFDLDLAEMIGTSEAEETKRNGFEMSVAMGDALRRLRGLDLISVAVVDGYAIGGGAEIATACDFRILTDQVRPNRSLIWTSLTTLASLARPPSASCTSKSASSQPGAAQPTSPPSSAPGSPSAFSPPPAASTSRPLRQSDSRIGVFQRTPSRRMRRYYPTRSDSWIRWFGRTRTSLQPNAWHTQQLPSGPRSA